VYAVLDGDEVRVDKELFGDAFRRPPRLTPLEARAIRLAIEFVGPMIAPAATRPLERVRQRLEETFGQFQLRETPEAAGGGAEEELIRTLSAAIAGHRLVRFEYLKQEDERPLERVVEPYSFERQLPNWYVHVWDRDRDAQRSFRLDRMRNAELLPEAFEPRPEFMPHSEQRTAMVLFSEPAARWRLESSASRHSARRLADGSALEALSYGSEDWLIGEILSFRGEAVLLEPKRLRARVAKRARELQRELAGPAKARR
jgi:proteasome accessory factor C